ncbi:MAG: fasciclin domain-containing protein [Betaproteobacteria bacterium]
MLKLKSLLVTAALIAGTNVAMAADIVDTAVAAGSFKTLVKAVKAAGLVDTLKGEGPFTVFAPTDAAFAKLPPGALDALLKDKEKLKDVLTYHVVPGKVMAANVTTGDVKTVEGKSIDVQVKGGKVTTDKANVIKTDIVASNGVIHVIDTVMMPN